MVNSEPSFWYVLRDLKRPNAKKRAYQELQEERYQLGGCVFTPIQQPANQPFLPDLVFVRATRAQLDPIVRSIGTLQYCYVKGCKQNDPLKIDNERMSQFLRAVSQSCEVDFLKPEEASPARFSKQIRLVDGPLSGTEGRLWSRRGSRVKRLLLDLPGLLTAAIAVDPHSIQLIADKRGS